MITGRLTTGTPHNLIGDKAYDSDPLAETCRTLGVELIAPHRKNRIEAADPRTGASCGGISAAGRSSGCLLGCKTTASWSRAMNALRPISWPFSNLPPFSFLPKSIYEMTSKYALARAEEKKAQAGVPNVSFHDANGDAIPDDHSFDFISTFDCLHDMANPTPVMHAIYQAIKPDGTWLIADIHSLPTFEENLEQNPLASMFYGFSVLCCMSSAMSEPNGEGLGTLGFTEPVARRMVGQVGFSRFKQHDFNNPINAYYEVRP